MFSYGMCFKMAFFDIFGNIVYYIGSTDHSDIGNKFFILSPIMHIWGFNLVFYNKKAQSAKKQDFFNS